MMKLLSFVAKDEARPGVVVGNEVVDLSTITDVSDLMSVIRQGQPALDNIAAAIEAGQGQRIPLADVRIAAPIARPPKIVCIGFNYKDHAIEYGAEPPERPVIFTKYSSSVTGPNDPVRWSAAMTTQVDYEVELGVVIGKSGRNIAAKDALDHVFGYMVLNDLSARDLQFSDHSGQWDFAKSLDGFCPCGPYLVTADDVPDPQALYLECRVNGQVLQSSNTSLMIFDIRTLIAYISTGITLEPGDVIATGTPAGIGMVRDPPIFLRDGDECICEIAGLGRQRTMISVDP